MSRNAYSRFALNPTNIDIQRSKFDRNSSVKFSGNVGDLIPFYVDEVLPGDTFQIKTSKLVRLQTLVAPIMDNVYLDTYYFFVPARLTWDHWKQFNGENTASKWVPTAQYSIPQLVAPAVTGWEIGTIADYMGIPTGVPGLSVNALPFRAYALICNEWFRDENNLDYLDIPTGDATVVGVNTGTFVTDVAKGGKPYIAAKYHDYFTSALPSPQKGNDVSIGLAGYAPVNTRDTSTRLTQGTSSLWWINPSDTSDIYRPESGLMSVGINSNGQTLSMYTDDTTSGVSLAPANLWTDLSSASTVTINALRLAFATQRMYEKDARGGELFIASTLKKSRKKTGMLKCKSEVKAA